MANKLGNQLLTRVQNEMARNIADIKRQLSEWLERPESGGIETLRKSMAEISGGLSLMEQNEAVELADAIITGIEGLDQNVNENGVTDLFAEQGAEIASGLLILADYIERLGHSSSGHKESVVQAATAIRTMLGNGEKIRVVAQPFISQDTYQALATEVNKIIEAARNQLEQYVRSPNSAFNAEAIINANHDLISLFQILNLQTPQSLLKQINQMLLMPLSEKQWIEVAEAMILVQETLKQLQENVVAEQVNNYHEAVHAQITHSRQLEIDKLINDTGKQGKTFFESLRKQVLQDETVKQKQPWLDAVKQLANYSAITALVNIRELANQLQQLALLFAEFTVQNDETISKTYVPVIDALVAVEYLFDDLAEVGKVSLQDVSFLAEAVQNIEKICPASARAKSLFIESANMTPSAAEDDAENTGDMQHFKDALGAGLDVLNDDFSTLEAENAEHEEEEPQEEENPPEQKYEAVLQASAGSAYAQDTSDATVIYAGSAVVPHTDTPPVAAHMPAAVAEADAATDSLTSPVPAKADEAAHDNLVALGAASDQSQANAEGKGSGAAYFANKTLRDLDKLEIPAEKEAFIASHSDAVVDEEIREFFSEELGEIVALMNDTYPKWREDSADTQLTGDIRRAFHTLKGSGRTVGYEALGEFAWQHEQLLNRVIEKDFSANSLVCDTVGDAISLLNILQQQDEFVEHKGALLQQALVAERVRLSLMDAPQSGQDALDALSRKLRLTDTEATAAPVATTSTTTAVTSSADEDDWSLLDDIVLKDEPTDDNGTTDTASTDSGAVAVSTDTPAPASHIAAQKTASDGAATTATASATISLADDSSATTGDNIAASIDTTAATDASATISLTDDSSAATGDSIAASIDTSAATDASTTISLADDSSAATGDSIAAGLDATATTDTSATISFADDSSAATGDSIAADLDATATTDTSATISFADDSSAATGDSIAAAHTTVATTARVADFSGEENYNKALRTLQRGLSMGEPDADMQAALAETIRRQWQQSVADDPALREAMAQSLLASFQSEGGAQQAQWVADILAQANAAGGAAVPVQPGLNAPAATDAPQHETPHGISEQAYNRMLNTLRRGLAAGADEDMQAVLSDSISRQWLQQGIATEGETRDDIIAHLKTALASEGAVDEATLDAMLAQVPHRVPSVLPEGVQQDSYGVMMETLRAGLDNASGADMQEMLATAIGNQWQSQNSLQDSAVRAAVAEQMAAVLGGDGHENAALVEAVLNRAAEKARETPAGLNPADYEHLLETLRSRMGEAQNSDAQEAIAASISSQLQSDNQLQDEATRDAIAQRVIAALGGQGETDAAAVEAILERVAVKVAGQQPAALPAGVRPEAYGAMLQTLSGGIAAAQSDEAAAEALAATIGAQWQEQHSLQDAATRAAVAQQISAALGNEADAATVEGVLNRAAAQAAGLPAGVKQEAYGEMLQTLRGGIANAQSDAAAAEALAATIGAQWQEQHSLQDAATRAAVAQQISAALGNEADTATVEGVLNRAAAQAAGLPAGVKQEAYGEMLQTLRAGISAAQSDAAAAEALAATIGAQWQEPHSLQDAATRAAVAQQISAALAGEADAATVEGVLNRAAAQAAGLPTGVKQEAYGEMLQTLRAGISAAQSDAAAAEALAASIGAQWQEPHSLQDAATRAAVAQQISAALGGEADAATVEGVLNRAAAQAVGLPQGVKHDAYSEMLQTMRSEFAAAQGDEATTEALATMLAAQWEEPHSLQDPAARAVVAAKISAALGGEVDAAAVEDVLARAAVQAAALPEGVKHEAYGEMLQTLRAGLTASHGDSAVAQEMLAASIGAQWADAYSLHDDTVRATVAARISEALGDKVDAATVAAILDRAVEKAAASALPKELSPEVYNRLLGTLRRGLQDGDADTQAALAATLQRHWEQNGLPQDPATIAAVQQHLGASLAAQGFASQQVDQVFAEAGLQANAPSVVVQAVLPPDAAQDDATTAPQVVDTGFFEVAGDDDAAAGDSAEGGFIDTATVPGDHPPLNDADIVNVPVAFANRPLSGDVQGGAGQAAANSVSIGDLSSILANMPRRVNPAERLSKELASLAQHPGLDDAVSQDKGSEISAAASRAGFLRAVDQFETLSQLADKTESPELIDDLIDAVYDIEDSIDADTAPQWVWRLLDSIEQLLLTHKHEGTPVSLSCAAVLRQSADLIENYEEEANEDDAIDAINSLLNARRELGGGKIHSAPATMPYSGDTLGSELVEDPNANTMLAETFIDEAMSLFAHSQEEAERWDENRSQLSRLDAIRRDIHTLKGSARMAGYNAIGDLTHGVESLIDGIVSGQVEPSSKATSILVGAMWQGMLMLDSVRDGYLPQTDPYILNNIHSYLNQPLPYPDVAEAAEAARLAQQQEAALEAEMRANAAASTLAEEPVVEELPVETDFDDNIDPVLVDIFTDEAQELLQTTSQLLEDDFSKKEVVEELQRIMHTLKGGARLVGFTAIGDTAHLMESVIDKVPELAEGKVRQAKTLLNFGLDAHYDMLDSVLRHEMPQPALEVNESLKTFADSGVFRPPSQKGGDNSDAAPETAEQTPADEAPQAADDAGGQAQEAGDSSAAPATGAASGSAGGGDSDASASAGSDSAASSGQATHAESAASATHSDHAAAAASSHGDSAAADKAGDGAASAAPSDSQHGGAAADKAGDGSAPAAHGDSQHSGAPADKAGDGAAPAAHGDNQHSGAAADKAGEGAAASGHDKDKGFDGKPEGVESVIEYGNDAQPEKKEEKKPEPARDSNISTDNLPRYVRVDAQLLDEMIAMTGETAIMRSRMENVISEAEFSLNELTRVAARIAEQMRRLDSETEAQLLYRREQQGEDDTHFDPLEMDRFTEIQQLSRQISEAIDDLKNLQDTLSQDNIILRNLSTQQGIIQRGIQDHLLTTQLMRFDVHEARLRRLVKQTAKSVGKDVNFVLEGGDVEVERRLLEDILPALEHMIRNSLAHGIEKPEERLAAGKPETGTIKLVVSVHAAELSVDLIDDGQGLNYERIREKAEAKGLLDPERADDEAYLSTLILRSGFSTAESLSQLAGRGVGMDVVNEMVKQRRGQIGVYSLRGKGTQFTLSMPFSMSIAEVLLVEIAGQSFAAPMSSIAAISQVDRDSLQRSFDGEIVYQHYNDQDYRQYILGAYFKPEQYAFAVEEQSAPVLFINAGGEPVAFHVDRIQNRLEIIVKNVNRQVLNIPGISGATILGDGRVVPVLELLDLSRRIANLTPIHDEVAAAAEARIPNVLVVDDSVTMRKVSTRLLERHHYNVATAKDGLDAIEVLATFTPDIILLDIEMPRMDGFEFASHVRSSSAVSDVPIVMITSRTGDKHRERADAIGVQGYLGKPYSEDVLIQTIEHLLQKRGDL